MVLAEMGWRLLNERTPPLPPADLTPPPEPVGGLQQRVFYPFTFPVTVGPGCIVVMVTVSAHASRSTLLDSALTHAGILLAVVVLSIMVYLSYSYAPRITQRIAPQTVHGIFRVIAFILLCIGVQIAWNGLELLIRGVAA
jgi:multiple antibiotic resistance protein